MRGLDALKWAIYNGNPIGVTTHLLGDEVDAGTIIERKLVPLYWNDTFHSIALRQYEMEVRMLVGAIEKLDEKHEEIHGENYPVHRRMPHTYECRLMDRFFEYIKKIPIKESD